MGSHSVSLKLSCFAIIFFLHFCNEYVQAKEKFTDKEMAALEKFRELVKDDLYKDHMKTDEYLIRWLRTKNFNKNEAAAMLRKAMKWRKDNKLDGILKEVLYDGLTPFYVDGIDNEGSVVATALASRWDTRNFVVSGKRNVPIRFWTQACESIEQQILKHHGVIGNDTLPGNGTQFVTLIFNLHGYNLRQHACLSCFSIYFAWFDVLENYYPGYVKHLIGINTPRIFTPLLELLKPLLSEQTSKALKVYGINKAEWYPAVIGKIVQPDQVRAAFGGTKPE